jgi:hypothetical protein
MLLLADTGKDLPLSLFKEDRRRKDPPDSSLFLLVLERGPSQVPATVPSAGHTTTAFARENATV